MSVRDLNKVIIISDAMTGRVLLTLDFDDYSTLESAQDLIADKVYQLIDNEDGAIIKIGSKG